MISPIVVQVFGSVKVELKALRTLPIDQETDQKTSIFTIIIGFGVIVAIINLERLQGSYKKWMGRRRSSSASGKTWGVSNSTTNGKGGLSSGLGSMPKPTPKGKSTTSGGLKSRR